MARIRWIWLLLVIICVSMQGTVCNLPEQNLSHTNEPNSTYSTYSNRTFETELRNNCSGQNVMNLGFFSSSSSSELSLSLCDVISSTFVQTQGHNNFFVLALLFARLFVFCFFFFMSLDFELIPISIEFCPIVLQFFAC